MVVVGKPLTQALRPMIETAINGINRLITWVQSMPDSMKTAMARVAVAASVLGGVAVAALGVAAALAAIGPPLASVAGSIAAAWPVLLGLAAALTGVGLGTAAMKVAVENDLGGVATYFTEKIAQVRLAVDALWQLFTTGSVRGGAAEQLMQPANEGILNFVTNIYTAGARIGNFFDGIATGFTAAVKAVEPVFADFRTAVEGLVGEFDGLSAAMDPDATKSAFDAAGESGESVGTTIGQMASMVIRGITGIIEVVTIAASRWNEFKAAVAPISEALSGIGTVLSDIGKEFSSAGGDGQVFSTIVGAVISVIASAISTVGHLMGAVLSMFRGIANIFMGVVNIIDGIVHQRWSQVWKGFAQIVYGVVTAVIGFFGGMVQAILGRIDAIGRAFGKDFGLASFIGDFKNGLDKEFKMALGLEARPWDGPGGDAAPVMTAPEDQLFATEAAANGAYTPAAASSEVSSSGSDALVSSINGMSSKLEGIGKQPVVVRAAVDLNVDGQVLASVVTDAISSSKDLSSDPDA
jgi:phage-related minor tail protein